MKPHRVSLGACIASCLTILSPTAFAQTWSGVGGDTNWSTADNWDFLPADGAILTFAGTAGTTNNNDTLTLIDDLTFAAGAGPFTLQGNALTMSGDFINNGNEVQTIDIDLSMSSSAHEFKDDPGSDTDFESFVFNGSIDYGTGRFFPNTENVEIVLNGSGTGVGQNSTAWTATGPSTWRANNTTYIEINNDTALGTGFLQLNGATYVSSTTGVTVANCFVIGNGSLQLVDDKVEIANGAVSQAAAGETTAAVVGAGNNRTLFVQHSDTSTISGDVYLSDSNQSRTLTVNLPAGGTLEITGNVHNNLENPGGGGTRSTLAVRGFGGTLVLSGTGNTFTGTSVRDDSILTINNDDQLADISSVNIEVSNGAVLNLNFVGTDTVTDLQIDGISQGIGEFGAIGSGADNEIAGLAGTGLIQVFPTAPAGSWDGGGADDLWTTAENWESDAAPIPGTGENLIFAGTTKTTNINDFPADSNFGQINFFTDAGPFTLTGNSVVLNSSTIVQNESDNDQLITAPVSVGSNNPNINPGEGQKVTFAGGFDFTDIRIFPNSTAGIIAFDAPGSGAGLPINTFAINPANDSGLNFMMRANTSNLTLELGDSQGFGDGALQINSFTFLQASTPLTGENSVGNTFVLGSNSMEITGANDLELDGSIQNFKNGGGDTGVTAGAIISAGNNGQNRTLGISNTGSTLISGAVYLNDGEYDNRTLFVPTASTAGPTEISGVIAGHVTAGAGDPGSGKPSGQIAYRGDGAGAGMAGGILDVTGDNTYNGDTSIASGSYLRIGHANALGATERQQGTSVSHDGDWDSGSTELRMDNVDGLSVGIGVIAAGIPDGTTVVEVGEFDAGNFYFPVTISQATTAAGTYPSSVEFSVSDVQIAGTIIGLNEGNTGTLDLNGFTIGEPIVQIAGAGSGDLGALINSSGTPAALTVDVTGVLSCSIGGAGDITVPRLICNESQTITKIGVGTFTTNGSDANSGASWVVTGGTVSLANSSGNGADGDVTVSGAGSELTLSGTNTNLISDTANVAIENGGVINLDSGASEAVATLTIDGAPQAVGTYGAAGSGADVIDDTHFSGAGVLNVTGASTGGGYDDWTAGFAELTDTNPELDFEQDGLATAIEWVVVGDPTANDAASVAPTSDNSDPDDFIYVFRRSDAAAADPNTGIVVEYGSDLTGWTTAEDGVDGVSISVDDDFFGEGIDRVSVSIPRALAMDSRLFARLSVVVTTP